MRDSSYSSLPLTDFILNSLNYFQFNTFYSVTKVDYNSVRNYVNIYGLDKEYIPLFLEVCNIIVLDLNEALKAIGIQNTAPKPSPTNRIGG
mgnify:CR=1 FL=1